MTMALVVYGFKGVKNITVTLCKKSEYIMFHYFLHIEVPKTG